ncbi:GPCR fungal pheromone mating factor [Mycena alexandri]|uniref:GPCR fungal pheromone mating factor n=1 Tax=Mycena alexandri TaxID=1745969 RepID=A0AAD6S388_9AGAR|nr:GPCR fungal pheromone mating factor [Mycena alexandri]
MSGPLPAAAFIAFALVFLPLLLHLRSQNIPLLSIIAWLTVSDLIYGINSIIWDENVDIVASPWCDITTKLKIGANIALPASTLVLALRVYRITLQKGRLGTPLELGICLGFPFIIMVLHTIVQGHRFDVYEDFGCTPAIFLSIPSIIILDIPPLVASAGALTYCSLALVNFAKQRRAFLLLARQPHRPQLTKAGYVRLVSLTLVLGVWNALVIALTRASAYNNGLLPWTNWDDVHADFWLVSTYPLAHVPTDVLGWLYFSWAAVPISSFFVFAFFGFGGDTTGAYRAVGAWFNTAMLRRGTGFQSTLASHGYNQAGLTKDDHRGRTAA